MTTAKMAVRFLAALFLAAALLGGRPSEAARGASSNGGGEREGAGLAVDPKAGITLVPYGTWRDAFEAAPTELGAQIVAG